MMVSFEHHNEGGEVGYRREGFEIMLYMLPAAVEILLKSKAS